MLILRVILTINLMLFTKLKIWVKMKEFGVLFWLILAVLFKKATRKRGLKGLPKVIDTFALFFGNQFLGQALLIKMGVIALESSKNHAGMLHLRSLALFPLLLCVLHLQRVNVLFSFADDFRQFCKKNEPVERWTSANYLQKWILAFLTHRFSWIASEKFNELCVLHLMPKIFTHQTMKMALWEP